MSEKYPCPKCGSKHSWFETEGDDLIQRCLCGLTRYLMREMEDGVTILRSGVRVPDVTLPAEGTKIYRCLIAVRNAHPKTILTGEVASRTGLKGKETASLVVTLMGRGLLERVEARRGLLGGSVWKLTSIAKDLLNVHDKGVDYYGTSTWDAGRTEFLSERHRGEDFEDSHADESDLGSEWLYDYEGDDWT